MASCVAYKSQPNVTFIKGAGGASIWVWDTPSLRLRLRVQMSEQSFSPRTRRRGAGDPRSGSGRPWRPPSTPGRQNLSLCDCAGRGRSNFDTLVINLIRQWRQWTSAPPTPPQSLRLPVCAALLMIVGGDVKCQLSGLRETPFDTSVSVPSVVINISTTAASRCSSLL